MSAIRRLKMLLKFLLILSHVSMISSSKVEDIKSERSVYVTDYCPKMKFCPEGAHVMCMYYDSKSTMGPRCSNAQNISMSPELANKLLDVSNAVRSRIAQGKEKGKNGEFLPRGYGVFRLKWDTELATFAQVLANQCVLRHDLCRATKRFPDPGQTAGLVRFSYPDWFPVSGSGNFTTSGINPAKLLYATTQILKSWYGQKNAVTPNMITYYPDWTLNPNSQNGRLYMEMIYGSATHMGCGISAYTEYAFYDNNAALNYNSVQIICNYSARPRKGTAVYNTVPPGDTAQPFSRCGCPVGSKADDECLCQNVERQPIDAIQQLKQEVRTCAEGQVCDPTVVVLPIFTIEDAPPEKLLTHQSLKNTSIRANVNEGKIQKRGNDLFHNKRILYATDKMSMPQEYFDGKKQKQSRSQQNIRPASHHKAVAIRNRYFDKKHIASHPHESGQSPRAQNVARKKISLFSRAAKFELPETLSIRPIKHTGIKDVVPRKDFSTAKQLVNKYLFGKNDLMKAQFNKEPLIDRNKIVDNRKSNEPLEIHEAKNNKSQQKEGSKKLLLNEIHEVKTSVDEQHIPVDEEKDDHLKSIEYKMNKNLIGSKHRFHDVLNILNATKRLKTSNENANNLNVQKPTTDTILNTAEQKLITQDAFLKQIVSNTNDYNKPLNSVTKETDGKLMALLDTLEQEVKHVELREKDKQLFDEKIRKIYGKVVGKHVSILDLNKHDAKSGETHSTDDVKKSYLIEKSVQQDPIPDPELLYENYRTRMEGLGELLDRRLESRNTSIIDRNDLDKHDERSSYKKRYGLRGIKHSDMSQEQIRSRYHEYENDHEYSDRKTYKTNFNRNNLEDEPRHRNIANDRNRDRNTEKAKHADDDIEHRNTKLNDLERRERNNYEHRHRNYGIDRTMRNKNYYLSNDAVEDDPLSVERRRFYQKKLDNIERRLQMRNQKRRKDNPRHMRPMRPASRKSESQMDIYGRGRFAHGY